MKKSLLIVLLVLILLLCSCGSDIARQGGIVVQGDRAKPSDITAYYAHDVIVYVTNSGTKYHTEDCSYLSSTKIPISLQQAIQEGKEPCSRCHPPTNDHN